MKPRKEENIKAKNINISAKGNPSVSARVWKSKAFRNSKKWMFSLFLFLTLIGGALVFAGTVDRNPGEFNFGIAAISTGLLFFILIFIVSIIGKEIYRIGIDYANGIVWVNRPSIKKIQKIEWANKIIKFQVRTSSNSKLSKGKMGVAPKLVKERRWELHAKLEGSDFYYAVPGSVFYSRKDAGKVIRQIKHLL